MTQHKDAATVAAERIAPICYNGLHDHRDVRLEIAQAIREAYAAQPTPNVEALAREAAEQAYIASDTHVVSGRFHTSRTQLAALIARTFAPLEHQAALRAAAQQIKTRIAYIGMPQEPMWEGRPDWRKEIALLEAALASAPDAPAERD